MYSNHRQTIILAYITHPTKPAISSTPTRCLPRIPEGLIRNITERIHVEGPLVGVLLLACTLDSP